MAALTQDQITQLAEQVGWSPSQVPTLLGIIGSESSGDPNVVAWGLGPTVLADSQGWPPPAAARGYDEAAVGLTQELIYPASAVSPGSIKQLQDPATNLTLALQKYRASGWQPWAGDAYVNAHPQLLKELPTASGASSSPPSPGQTPIAADTTGLNLSLPGALFGGFLGSLFPNAAKDAAEGTAKGIAGGISGALLTITGASSFAEIGIRAIEIVAGAILFAVGLFALIYVASGRSMSGDLTGAAKGGAALSLAAL